MSDSSVYNNREYDLTAIDCKPQLLITAKATNSVNPINIQNLRDKWHNNSDWSSCWPPLQMLSLLEFLFINI